MASFGHGAEDTRARQAQQSRSAQSKDLTLIADLPILLLGTHDLELVLALCPRTVVDRGGFGLR